MDDAHFDRIRRKVEEFKKNEPSKEHIQLTVDETILLINELVSLKEQNTKLSEELVKTSQITGNEGYSIEALHKVNLLYGSMISNISDVIGIISPDGIMKYKSPNITKWFGWLPDERIGTNALATIHPDDLEHVQKIMQEVLENGGIPVTTEFRYQCKDGSYKPVEVTSVNLINDHLINGILLNYRDITNRKKEEEALLESESRFRLMSDNAPVLIWESGTDTQCNYVNKSYIDFTGRTPEQELGKGWTENVHPEDLQSCIESYLESFRKKCKFRIEYRLMRADGQYRWILNNGIPRFTPDGSFSGYIGSCIDITDIRQAEIELQKSERRLRAITDSANDAILMMDEEGKISFWNPAATKILGYTRDEAMGKVLHNMIAPTQFISIFDNAFPVFQKNGQGVALGTTSEYQAIRKDGKIIPVELSISAIQQKGTWHSVGILHDISARKLAEEKLKANISRLELAMESANMAWWELDLPSGNVIFDFRKAEMLGFPPETFKHYQDFIDLVHPEDKERIISSMLNLIDGLSDKYGGEYRIMTHSGEYIWILDIGSVTKPGSTGKPLKVSGIVLNINERKLAEEDFNETNTYLQELIGHANVPIIVWNSEYQITRFNPAFELLTGRKESEVIGQSLDILFSDETAGHSMNLIQKTLTGERLESDEIAILRVDNTIRTVLWNSASLYGADGKTVIAVIAQGQDVSQLKDTETTLLNAIKEAEAANRSKSIFLANMSQEIRTPLNSIIGFSQLLIRENLSDLQKEYIVSIHRSGEHLLKLLNDILELSKIEAGRAELNPTDTDLFALFSDINMMFREQAQSKQLRLLFEIQPDVPNYIFVDSGKLRQIMVNLIGNAIKFTHEGGIAVRARISKSDVNIKSLVIEIQDSGVGISENDLGKLFKQFEQASAGIKQSTGTGLGLALSRQLAVLMGGNISISSEEGNGSVFTFNVEVKEGKLNIAEANIPKRVIGIENPGEKYLILVVDDMQTNLVVAEHLLQLAGFETHTAINGEDAIEKFEKYSPHLILMDMRMPVMDGYKATARIKATEKGSQTPIIAVTASQFEDEKAKIFMLDIQGYIRKPFRENEFFDSIGAALGINYIYE